MAQLEALKLRLASSAKTIEDGEAMRIAHNCEVVETFKTLEAEGINVTGRRATIDGTCPTCWGKRHIRSNQAPFFTKQEPCPDCNPQADLTASK